MFLRGNNLEFISHAPNGFQRPFVAGTLQLVAQSLDVNVNRSGIAGIVEAPDLIEKLISRENVVIIGGKEVKQLQFLR